jgi:hypothetical protein
MIEAEYVSLNPSQQNYSKKNFLYCELELLNTVKHYKKYRKLRKEELALKSLLRRTLNELKAEIKTFESLLPDAHDPRLGAVHISRAQKARQELDDEITDIKKRLAELG